MPRDEFEYHETNLNTTSRIWGKRSDGDVLWDVKTYYSTRRRMSENISQKNETRLTDFSARALPILNLIAVNSAATGRRDLTVLRSLHALNAPL